MEYTEEHPPILSSYGMGSLIKQYYFPPSENETLREKVQKEQESVETEADEVTDRRKESETQKKTQTEGEHPSFLALEEQILLEQQIGLEQQQTHEVIEIEDDEAETPNNSKNSNTEISAPKVFHFSSTNLISFFSQRRMGA